ncbi:GNAT family N-acetyltransferase [Pinisolibacter sp. B13]|nr:GNAT family N-acetyltransferase [Pinisolibacter aquiterrae]
MFEVKGARRLYAYVEDGNFASQRLCERLGMRREGLFREFVSFVNDDQGNPIYENTTQHAILRREWMA